MHPHYLSLTRHHLADEALSRILIICAQTRGVSEPGKATKVVVGGQHTLIVPGADDTQVLDLEFERSLPFVPGVCLCVEAD
jgi:hypothetical protein